MPRFYVDELQVDDNLISLTGSDVNHIKNVLRMKIGESLTVCDGQGNDFYCIISQLSDDIVEAIIKEKVNSKSELSTKLYLFQALPKADKMELIIQKAVELGAFEVIPVKTSRCVVKLNDEKKAHKKLERWQSISMSAAKQSGRGCVPHIHEVMSFKEAVQYAKEMSLKLMPYENETDMGQTKLAMDSVDDNLESIAIFIGPEGGFADEEVDLIREQQFKTISLGKRILRTETAGLMILSVLMFRLEKGI